MVWKKRCAKLTNILNSNTFLNRNIRPTYVIWYFEVKIPILETANLLTKLLICHTSAHILKM